MFLATAIPMNFSFDVNLASAGIFLLLTIFLIWKYLKLSKDTTMQVISEKINAIGLYSKEWGKDDNKQHKRLHDEIQRLTIENEMLKKGNWYTAYLVNKASKKLMKLYKIASEKPLKINVMLPKIDDTEQKK